jgi:glycosyltransferase involved in cell wall biosynthesis
MVGSTGAYVLVLNWDPSRQGGVTAVVRQLERNIAAAGWLTPVVAVDTWEALVPRRNGTVWYLRLAATGSPNIVGILKALLLLPVVLWNLHRWLKAIEAKVVNFHFPALQPLGVLALRALRLYRGRVILSFHGRDVRPPADRLERWIRSWLLERADAVVACSASLADRLSQTFDLPRNRVTVVYNGVDSSVFRPDARPPDDMPESIPASFLLHVGSFIPRKDHKTLLRAFARIADRHPRLNLVLAGADGPDREVVLNEVRNLGLGHRVTVLVGLNQEQVAWLLAKCCMCIQPALAESFPLAVLEAAASGAFVIASRIPGHDEIIDEGVSGLMFPVGDAEACAAAIEAMLGDPVQARAMADTLRAKVVTRFSWSACADAYRSLAVG